MRMELLMILTLLMVVIILEGPLYPGMEGKFSSLYNCSLCYFVFDILYFDTRRSSVEKYAKVSPKPMFFVGEKGRWNWLKTIVEVFQTFP